MRIDCEGWHRNHGQRNLFTGQLSDADVSVGNGPIGYNSIRLELQDIPPNRRHSGEVRIRFRIDTRSAPLNGEYLMSIALGQSDILRLFRGGLDDFPLGKLIELLSDAEVLADN